MIAIMDTGPWVALIDRSESRHAQCVDWIKNFYGKLYSTEAVLTEVLYILNLSITAQCAALDFVLESVVEIVPSSTFSLKKTNNLMKKYADLPVDFTDATIVCLAMETGIQNIVTFDRKDFAIYKLPKKKSFKVMPYWLKCQIVHKSLQMHMGFFYNFSQLCSEFAKSLSFN